MTDVHTKSRRSYNMSRIRAKDTKPEILLRKFLWRAGYRYSLKGKLPGRPDIVMKKYKLAVFIDGCFWHACPKHFRQPTSNQSYWEKKIAGNIARDKKNNKLLKKQGWTVLRFWEHEVKKHLPSILKKVAKAASRSKK